MTAPAKTCAAPGCTKAVERRHRRGRPPIYCSPACRASSHALSAKTSTLVVEVDHEQTDDARPAGRVWLVRLRRGSRAVTVASELGRPSADHLAAEISTVIAGQQATRGGAIG